MEKPVVLVEPSEESLGAQANPRPPVEKMVRGPAMRQSSRSVLKVSQLLLRAICAHRRLTMPTLRKELGNAGYEVSRRVGRQSRGGPSRPQGKGALLRVSGSNAAGYFRVRKVLRPKKKPARRRLEESSVGLRRVLATPRVLRRRRTLRKAAKKAREVWRRDAKRKRLRKTRGRGLVRPKAKVGARPKVKAKGKPRTRKEAQKPDPREDGRASSSSKPPEKKKQETPVKRTPLKPTQAKTDLTSTSVGQGVKAAQKASTKFESSKPAMETP
ncbi:testis-specific H1 histone [Echinops telfairi]|uniref:Testis-specific H1 histone n=1 Tax=Echinops telfairi TaxID=9371 RepID=A0ABM0IZM6_ECHTE|nr:testis-specific H1 histone [Echinops telfairi]